MEVEWKSIYGLYSEGWGDRLTPESYQHPAKIRPAVAREIFKYALERGWWKAGDVLIDCFGGIGGLLLTGGWAGLRMYGVELEQRFVDLCNANIELHAAGWDSAHPRPVILHGDSRNLAALVGEALGVVSSPPYESDGLGHPRGDGAVANDHARGFKQGHTQGGLTDKYGSSPGNLGNLRPGSVDGLATSPPYAESLQNPGGGRVEDGFGLGRSTPGVPCGPHSQIAQHSYGASPGQLGAMPPAGQLGNERGPTFWQAARDIVAQCHAVLRDGAMTTWVCKNFVRNKQVVPFCDDWCRLLELCGFRVVERWRMWQRSKATQPDFYGGAEPVKQHLGFFRRLAQAKGSPKIEWEECIWAERRLHGDTDLGFLEERER